MDPLARKHKQRHTSKNRTLARAWETLMAHDFMILGGEKAANCVFLGCKLGAPARLLPRTGDDNEAREALRPLEDLGVNLEHVKQLPDQ